MLHRSDDDIRDMPIRPAAPVEPVPDDPVVAGVDAALRHLGADILDEPVPDRLLAVLDGLAPNRLGAE